MMGFTNDYSQAQDFSGVKPEGDYEVLIVKAEEKQTKNGKTGLNLKMVIRNDVDQKFQNGYLFHTLWKRKEPTAADLQVNGYGFGQVMALGKAAGLPDGKDYASLAYFLADLIMKPVRVRLKHEEYNGTVQERVDCINPSSFTKISHVMKKPKPDVAADEYAKPAETSFASQSAAATSTPDTLLDDDVPF